MAEENSTLLEAQTFTLLTSKAPTISPTIEQIPVGATLKELFDQTDFDESHTKIYINDSVAEDWSIVPDPDSIVTIQQNPGDLVTIGISVALSLVAGVLAYKMYKPEEGNVPDENRDDRIRGSRNTDAKYKPIPFVLGKRRITPPYAAKPYSYWKGDKQCYKVFLCAGYGPLKIEDIRIGDIPIANFKSVSVGILDWYTNTSIQTSGVRGIWGLDVLQNNISEEVPQIEKLAKFSETVPLVSQSPSGDPDADIALSVVWPRGVIRITESGRRESLGGCAMITYQDQSGRWLCPAQYGQNFFQTGSLPFQVWKNGTSFFIYSHDKEDFAFKHDGRPNPLKSSYNGNDEFGDPIYENIVLPKLVNIDAFVVYEDTVNDVVIIDYDAFRNSADPRLSLETICSVAVWARTEQLVQKEITFKPFNVSTAPVTFNVKNVTPKSATGGSETWSASAELFTISRTKPLTTEAFYSLIGMPNRLSYPDIRPVIIAIDVQASEQLSGSLDNINMLATTVVPNDGLLYSADWSQTSWFKTRLLLGQSAFQTTENPAKLYQWLLQGPMNSRPVPRQKIDISALQEWATTCDTNYPEPWRCSQYVDYEAPLKTVLNNIASTGRAEFSMRDGKFSVVERKKKTIPTQIFTPKNSRDFSSRRNFPEKFDGIEFEFDNEELNYEKDSGVYFDSQVRVDQRNGTFTKLPLWGIPSGNLAQRHARFALLEEKLRREVYELTTDIEGLVAQRGDMVRIANDVIDVGLGQGFITSFVGNNFSIDETKDLVVGVMYAVQVRNVDSGTKLRAFNAIYNGDGQWTSTTTRPTMSVGDLAVYGRIGSEVLEAIVLEVKYNNDYEATLTLANAANIIYDLDGEYLPPYETNLTSRPENNLPTAPIIKITGADALYIEPFITVSITNINRLKASTQLIRVQYASSTDEVGTESPDTDSTLFWQTMATQDISQPIFRIPVSAESGITHYFRAQALGSGNLASDWSSVVSVTTDPNSVANVLDYTVTEFKNLPPTPNGTYNTMFVVVTPPTDVNFSKPLIEYRPVSGGDFKRLEIGIGNTGKWFTTEVFVADGASYLFRVRSISTKGVVNQDGLEFIYKTTNTLNPVIGEDEKPEENLNVPNVTGLELFDQGNDTNFVGRDAKFSWNKTNFSEWVNLGLEGLKGASTTSLAEYFRDYEVVVSDPITGEIRRTEYVTDNFYIYSWEKNREDAARLGDLEPLRQFKVSVVMRSRQNGRSPVPAELVVQNPAPQAPALIASAGYNFIVLKYNQPSDLDWVGTKFWISEVDGFIPDQSNPAFNGPDTTVMLSGLDAGVTYYLRWQPYDAFGAGEMADQFTIATAKLNSRDLDETPPSVPTNLAITTGVLDSKLYTQSWVTLTWDASIDPDNGIVQGYFVERWDSVDSTRIQANVANLTYTITGAVPGRTYYMRVAAQDWAGNTSAFSDTVSIVAAGDLVAPDVVTSTSAVAGLDKVVVSWTNPSNLDFLAAKIYRDVSSGFTPNDATNLLATVAGEPAKQNSFVDAEVSNGTDYYYKIIAVDVSGNESTSTAAIGPASPFKLDSANFANYFETAAIGNAYIADLDASKITAGDIATGRLTTNFLAAAQATISQLSAITADVGTLTAGTISGVTYQTSGSTAKVLLNSTGLTGTNSSGTITFRINTDGSGQLGSSGNGLSWGTNGVISVPGSIVTGELVGNTIKTALSGWRTEIDATGVKYWDGTTTTFSLSGAGNFRFGPSGATSNYIDWNGSTFTIAVDKIGSGASNSGANSVALGSNSVASGTNSIAVGNSADALAQNAIAIGVDSVVNANNGVAIGNTSQSFSGSTCVGFNATSLSASGLAIGNSSLSYTGSGNIAIGSSVTRAGNVSTSTDSNIAIGNFTQATLGGCTAVGALCSATGTQSTSFGNGANSSATHAMAIGVSSQANTAGGIGLGYNSKGNGSSAISIGANSTATGGGSVSIGASSSATQAGSIAIGNAAQATGFSQSIAIGDQASAPFGGSTAIGANVATTTTLQIKLGTASHAVRVDGSFSVGGTKSFKIPHPTKENFYLKHSAIESPTAGDNLYRYQIETVNNSATISLPDYFSALNKDIQIFVTPEKHFGAAYGEIVDNTCTITSNKDGLFNVLIIGTRKDPAVAEWDIFGAEVPMTDNEIEQMVAAKEKREPVFAENDTYLHVKDEVVKAKCDEECKRKHGAMAELNEAVQRKQQIINEKIQAEQVLVEQRIAERTAEIQQEVDQQKTRDI